jgi:hypothetical protein
VYNECSVFHGKDEANIDYGVAGKSVVSSAAGRKSAKDNIVLSLLAIE